jgi:SAM-dependent methyltransferase
LIDLGCGNGTQTRFLARHLPQVIGVDVSPAAIQLARAGDHRAEYLMLDMLDAAAVTDAHDRVGDAHVYMRGVLHQILPAHRAAFLTAVRTLLGRRGCLYLVELAPGADAYFEHLATIGQTPADRIKIARHGIVPGNVRPEDVQALLGADAYTIADQGDTVLTLTHVLPDCQPAQVPAFHMTLRPT